MSIDICWTVVPVKTWSHTDSLRYLNSTAFFGYHLVMPEEASFYVVLYSPAMSPGEEPFLCQDTAGRV